jgi:hypothetical protein
MKVLAVVHLAGQRARRLDRRSVTLIQRQDGARRSRMLGQLAHVHRCQRMLLEQRIAERFLKNGRQPCMIIVGEGVEINIQHLRNLHQQVRRQRPLIVLDEIEVARRDLQPRRQIALRQPLAASDRSDFRAEVRHRILLRGTACSICPGDLGSALNIFTDIDKFTPPHSQPFTS